MKDILVRIGGDGGEGIISSGDLLTMALARSNYEVFTFRTFPAEIKGGPAMFQVRFGDQTILSQGHQADILVTLNEEAFRLHHAALKPDGLLVYEPAHYKPEGSFEAYAVPLDEIASHGVKSAITKNMVALGVVARVLDLSFETLEQLIRERFGKKGDAVVAKNLEALKAGSEFVAQHPVKKQLPVFAPLESSHKHVVMSGNEALTVGAISAGCRYFGGYPITPASDILELMERELPKFGGAVVQTEDEIAAIASVIGASFAGKKAMTATSGPGLALMVEELGLATMAEIPCVVVDAQRGGPSTGLPTKMEQGDLNLAVYGAHGDAPRIVLAPGDVEECLYYMIQAFNLAEKYQTPVIFLTDQSLAHRTQTYVWPDFSRVPVINRLLPSEAELKEYDRYKITPDGISPMAIPGMKGGCYAATGLEHTEEGFPSFVPKTHTIMSAKRAQKIEEVSREKGFTARFGEKQAKIGVIGWGSTQGAIREAVEMAIQQGLSVAQLQLKMVYPLPEADLLEFLQSVEQVLIAELNYMGQLNQLFQSKFLIPTQTLTKCEGLPFFAEEILAKLKEMSGSAKAAAQGERLATHNR
ncbi:MAG: 2-oxoacid:acceptor oxidoreductase subunit alpha [Elusimicrobiota bacterium]